MDEERKSRTQKKNEDRNLQRLGEQLAAMAPSQLETLELPEELMEAIQDAHAIKSKAHGARRRQLQRIGVIMRHIDPKPIQDALARMRFRTQNKT